MIAVLRILYNAKVTYEYLDNKYEDELNSNCNIIFLIVGALAGLAVPELRPGETPEMFGEKGIILYTIISIAFSAIISLLLGRYLTTYVLYGLSKLLSGKGEVIDMRVVAAYSLIPRLLQIPLILYLGFSETTIETSSLFYWIVSGFYIFTWIWMLKIMVQGLIYFNKYQTWKAVIAILPTLMIGLITNYYNYFYPLQ